MSTGLNSAIPELVESVFEALDADRVGDAVAKCLRIARLQRDHLNIAVFYRESIPHKPVFADLLTEDFVELKKEAFRYVFEQSGEIWLRHHSLRESFLDDDESIPEGDKRNVFALSVREIDIEIQQSTGAINDYTPPEGMSQYDTAAFWHSSRDHVATLRARIKGANEVKQNIAVYCLNYAIGVDRRLKAQSTAGALFDQALTDVNNYFAAHSDDVYKKLIKALALLSSEDQEDMSLLMTSIRRCLAAAADHFYPASDVPVMCADGRTKQLGPDQYLNRLEEYLNQSIPASGARDLLKKECALLGVAARRLNSVASKGVHSDVVHREARQGLLSLYLFLYNVICFAQRTADNE